MSTAAKTKYKILSAVGRKHGKNAPNLLDDVLTIQSLLKQASEKLKRPEYDPKETTGAIPDPPAKSATLDAITAFQKRFTSKPDGQIDAAGGIFKKLVAAATGPTIKLKIVHGRNYKTLDGTVALDVQLQKRVTDFCKYLIENDLVIGNIVFTQGVRAPATAHRWSTSWNIRKGHVPLKNLQALTDGKDSDGNQWYDKAWEEGLEKDAKGHFTKGALATLWSKIKANSLKYYDSTAIAAEGYTTKDERIKPNVHPVQSNHIFGNAMDVSIEWRAGAKVGDATIIDGKTSDHAANQLVAKFGLSRPVPTEKWHFQLGTTAMINVSSANVTGEHPQDKNPHP